MMPGPVDHAAHMSGMAALYRQPDSEYYRQQLSSCMEGITGAIAEAVRAPTPERLERLATWLEGMRRLTLEHRSALLREGVPDGVD